MRWTPDMKPLGLMLDVNPLAVPPGALTKAQDIILRKPGIAECRPGFYDPTTAIWAPTASYVLQSIVPFGRDSLLLGLNGSTWQGRWSSDGTTVTTAPVPVNTTERHFGYAEARGSLYLTTSAGVTKTPTAGAAGSSIAGLPRAKQGKSVTYDGGTTAKNWLAINYYVSWRIVWKTEDVHGYIIRSAPSGRMTLKNGAAARAVTLTLPITGSGLVAGDEIEVYRTASGSGTETGEEYQLAVTYVLTATDISNDYATVNDNTDDDNLGASLYTNPGQLGASQENGRPPIVHDVEEFRGSMFYGRVEAGRQSQVITLQDAQRWDFRADGDIFTVTANVAITDATMSSISGMAAGATSSEIGVGQLVTEAGQAAGSASAHLPWGARVASVNASDSVELDANALANGTGISVQFSDVIDIDGNPYYAWSSESVANSTFQWNTQTAGAGDTVRQAANSLAYVVNRLSSDVSVSILSSGVNEAILLIEWLSTPTSFDITLTNGKAWSPSGTNVTWGGELGTLTVGVESVPGRLFWSRNGLPEAVPPVNFTDVGDAQSPIYRIVRARDALWIFKSDGVWKLTGTGADAGWRVDPVSTSRVVGPRCVDRLGDDAVAWMENGVYLVSQGLTQVDQPIQQIVSTKAQLALAQTSPYPGTWVRGNVVEGELYVGVPDLGNDDHAGRLYVYNVGSRGWTTWEFGARDLVLDGTRTLRLARADIGYGLRTERIGTPYDCADESYAITLADAGGGAYDDTVDTWTPAVGDRAVRSTEPTSSGFVLNDDDPDAFTLSVALSTGGGFAYVGIPCVVEWVVSSGGSARSPKWWLEGELTWRKLWDAYQYTVGVKGDTVRENQAADEQLVVLDQVGSPTATFDLDHTYEEASIRFWVPRGSSLSSLGRPRIEIRQAGVCFELLHCALGFDAIEGDNRRQYGT